MIPDKYIFQDVAVEPELRRLRAIEAVFDPGTQRQLLTTGEWLGRHCLEVGAGAGSIAAWMRAQVGATGRVVAVDTNVGFLDPLRLTVEVVHGDVRQVDLAAERFDVAHVRYVLIHNGDPAGVLHPVIRSLKPGGWLLVEEPDFSVAHALAGPDATTRAFERVNGAIQAMFSGRGLDPALGRRVPSLFRQAGLELVAVESDAAVERGGSPLAQMMGLSASQLGDKYVATRQASPEDVVGYQDFAADPSCWGIFYATVRTLARRPALAP